MANETPSAINRLAFLKEVGNYSALRRLAGAMLADASTPSAEKAKISQILKTTEPDPLVFWIGMGSVGVAAALAFVLI